MNPGHTGHVVSEDKIYSSLRVAWLTNRAAPYRRPVWKSLSDKISLTVFLLESPTRFSKRLGNRGAEWTKYASEQYTIRSLRTARLVRGESNYFLTLGIPLPRRRLDAVVLGGWESPAYWQALLQAKMCGIRTIGFYESTLESQRYRKGIINAARSRYFRSLDRVVVPGQAAQRAVVAMGVDPDRIDVGFNAVDVAGIYQSVSKLRRAATKLLRSKGHTYVFIGQLIPRKNPIGLIRAFASIRSSEDKLIFVGQGVLLQAMQALVHDLGLENYVVIRPMVDYAQVPELLHDSHTLVLPSTEEVWGLVVNEALAAGLHAVVTEECGVSSSVRAMHGVYVTPSDVDSLAKAMAASRANWRGYIDSPAILAHSPQVFADIFISSIASALQSKRTA